LWRNVALRGTGFPISTIDGLSGIDVAAVADAYSDARAEVIQLRRLALAEIGDALRICDPQDRTALRTRRRRIRAGRIATSTTSRTERALAAALSERERQLAHLTAVYRAEMAQVDARLRNLLTNPRFREAVLWQNQPALALLDRRFRTGANADAGPGAAANLVAMLVQRYALKNDSIGFFGPVGWSTVSERSEITPSRELLATRAVYFEGWCIDALAATLDANPLIKRWTAPRLAGGVWIDSSGAVFAPVVGRVPVTDDERRVLAFCDGRRAAADITELVLDGPSESLASEQDVFRVLQALVERHLVLWRLEVAPQLHPDRELRACLERIGDQGIRTACLAALDEIVQKRDEVARSAGSPEALDRSLTELNATFTRLTGRAARRRAGQMYAGRSLVYEDCRRAGHVTLGPELMARLGPPLTLVLESARWVAAELARGFRREMRECYAALRACSSDDTVDAHALYTRVSQIPLEQRLARIRDVERTFRERWRSVFDAPTNAKCVVRSVDELAPRARTAFAVREKLWSRIQFLSPDVMVAADGSHAFCRGAVHFVLGEIHSGNGLLWSALASQHPNSHELAEAIADDARHVTPFATQVAKGDWSARLNVAARPATAWRYEFHDDRASEPGCRVIPAGMLVPFDDGAAVRMRARDGSVEFDAIELFGMPLCWEVDSVLKQYLPDAAHLPRLTIGALTIGRERWLATRDDFPFLTERDRAARFAAMRAWARARGLPRYVFYKLPRERKPCFLDLDSPLYVDLFVKGAASLEQQTAVRIDEMLPEVRDAWLTDENGGRYLSEFRFAARLADVGGAV
jgi:hypothetical protein